MGRVMGDWKYVWVLQNGRWDEDGTALVSEALGSGDWSVVEEFAEVIDRRPHSEC